MYSDKAKEARTQESLYERQLVWLNIYLHPMTYTIMLHWLVTYFMKKSQVLIPSDFLTIDRKSPDCADFEKF